MSLLIARQARACATHREVPRPMRDRPIPVVGAGRSVRTATARAAISGGRTANSPRIPGRGRYKRAGPYPRAAAARRTSWVRTGGRRRAQERSSWNLSLHKPPQKLCRYIAPNVLNEPCTTIRVTEGGYERSSLAGDRSRDGRCRLDVPWLYAAKPGRRRSGPNRTVRASLPLHIGAPSALQDIVRAARR
jgi:hypothetical protein